MGSGGEGGDEGGPQECEYRSEQRGTKVRLWAFCLWVYLSLYLIRPVLSNPFCDWETVEESTSRVDSVENSSLSVKKFDFCLFSL